MKKCGLKHTSTNNFGDIFMKNDFTWKKFEENQRRSKSIEL